METIVTIRRGTAADVPHVLRLIKELAEYEKSLHEVAVTEEDMVKAGFGPEAIYTVNVAELNGEVVGIALFFLAYSTWKGKMVYLEDLVVTEQYRCLGIGKQLFESGIVYAKEVNAAIYKWQVLKWNTPAIEFYKKYNSGLDGEWFNGYLSRGQLDNIDTSSINIK